MNREEAKSRLNLLLNEGQSPYDLIDYIYADFDSRTCESCINYSDTEDEGFWCEEFESSFININERPVGFGCNKFERKKK